MNNIQNGGSSIAGKRSGQDHFSKMEIIGRLQLR